jgi:predicted secreted protein
MSIPLGLDCKLFRGTAGGQATTEIKNCKDVTLNMESGEADITTRAAQGWRQYAATLKEGSIEFDMNYDIEDTDFQAIQDAFFANSPLAIFVTDGSGNGLLCDCVVTQFNISQPLEEASSVSVTLRPTNIGGSNGRAPQWVEGT